MSRSTIAIGIGLGLLLAVTIWGRIQRQTTADQQRVAAAGRDEVVFWHFWGGRDRAIVEDVARRFNSSQSRYFVRPIAMPGNNLQAKLFLAVTGVNSASVRRNDVCVSGGQHLARAVEVDAEELCAQFHDSELFWRKLAKRLHVNHVSLNGGLYGL